MNHALDCAMSGSRCSFIEDTLFRPVAHRRMVKPHLRSGSGDCSMTVPIRTLKCLRQSLQRQGIGFPFLTADTRLDWQ